MSQMRTLEGKVAIVTGGAAGIGAATAKALAEAGASVGVLDRDAGTATVQAIVGAGGVASSATADVSDESQVRIAVDELTSRLGECDILVNIAGISAITPLDDLTLDTWRRLIDVNLTGTFIVTQAVLPMLKRNGDGRIINTASSSIYSKSSGMVPYIASKGGVIGLTSALSSELGVFGITVNAVTPGVTRTPPMEAAIAAGQFPPNIDELMMQAQSIPRKTSADDMAGAVVFLAGPTASMVTGQFLTVDGGLTRHY
ncbi:SDR family NAD(P)-dependent oxidoreductase [Microbacterium sp.]|uniref:SDR family NAD(P)-dependent oxidoreductase n=1 Tax=Microbacterium sp. TaxID=51671 RepID=UPI003A85A5BD